MIEFKIRTYREKVNIPDYICESFKDPIIYYLAHREDLESFFTTFVIIDFSQKELIYIHSYFPENIEKMKQHKDRESFFVRPYCNPHCSLQINSKEDFYTFMEGANYFFYVNYKKNIMKVYHVSDIIDPQNGNEIREIGSTFYKDDENGGRFYFTVEERKTGSDEKMLKFCKTNLDLSDIQVVYRTSYSTAFSVPHVTRKFKKYLLNSEFSSTRYQNNQTGEIFSKITKLSRYVYNDLYRDFCIKNNTEYSEKEFFEKNEIIGLRSKLTPEFKDFCRTKGADLMEICKNIKKYNFSILPGLVSVLDLESKEMSRFETTFCAPGHFEIDSKENAVYTSSHNFMRDKINYFFGPAAIDKFLLRNGKMEKVGTFFHETGYRFTSHRVFYNNGEPYLCTIGHPNRLFFFNAEDMTIHYAVDLFGDVLSDKIDIAYFLNNSGSQLEGKMIYIAMEVSYDGEFILLVGYMHTYIFSFSERRIVAVIPNFTNRMFEEGVSLRGFFRRTTHVNYLI